MGCERLMGGNEVVDLEDEFQCMLPARDGGWGKVFPGPLGFTQNARGCE